jgi:amidase
VVSELCFTPARELAERIRGRTLSARELMVACLDQIRRANGEVNAIVARLDDERCLALAEDADDRLARGEAAGPLHGLPWAFKDVEAAVGFPQTQGSLIYRDFMPAEDSFLVERLRRAGVVPIGKTNVPEFARGGNTYNEVYGRTRNPWDLTKTAGGSSGGAAAAIASGMLPMADGSDLGGSLRIPASFNNVVGLRTSVGLVPAGPYPLPWVGFSVKGPMARSVADVAFLMSAMAGADRREPLSYPSDPSIFAGPLDRDFRGTKVAWCPDLGGLPLEPEVRALLEAQRSTFEALGCIVEDACPDLSGSEEAFFTIRRWRSWVTQASFLEQHRDQLKPEAIEEIAAGARISGTELGRAMTEHGEVMNRVRQFQEEYPFLICTTTQMSPFDVETNWPRVVDGVPMGHYMEGWKSCYLLSTTFCPALSVPAGLTPEGLPLGIQILGRYRDDFGALQLGHAFEQATGFGSRRPPVAVGFEPGTRA